MKEILHKLSSYNILNNLLPGILYIFVCNKLFHANIESIDTFSGIFIYYFIGMSISRFGSLILEPILKKVKFLKFSDYRNYITASQKDELILTLSETNNTYRTIISLTIMLLITKCVLFIKTSLNLSDDTIILLILSYLFILFAFAYKKQSNFINQRILKAIDSN